MDAAPPSVPCLEIQSCKPSNPAEMRVRSLPRVLVAFIKPRVLVACIELGRLARAHDRAKTEHHANIP